MKIYQIVASLSFGDAVGNDVLTIDRVLHEKGYEAYIYANIIADRYRDRARFFTEMPELQSDDVLIYHMAIACDMSEYFITQKCKKIMRYHNLTPTHFYLPYSRMASYSCEEGLRQIKNMYDKVDFCINDSDFNSSNLKDYGYKCGMRTVPIVIPFDDYERPVDQEMYDKYKDGLTNIVFVGRIAPNKKFEDVIQSFYYYQKYWNPDSRLILVGNPGEENLYYDKLQEYIEIIGVKNVEFTGHISFPGILACYKVADLFLCLSEHEGFCVPLIEAMIFHKPVVAYASCAVPETMGEGTLRLQSKDPREVAATVNHVLTHPELSKHLVEVQDKRLEHFKYETVSEQFINALREAIC